MLHQRYLFFASYPRYLRLIKLVHPYSTLQLRLDYSSMTEADHVYICKVRNREESKSDSDWVVA